jgi:polysaccharide pyruvyl transferase CsaB
MPELGARYPSLSVTIAGGGNALPRLRARAAEVNRALGREAIALVGWAEDLPTLMRAHRIFVGVSRAAMEACASGCAVILCGNEGYLGILSRARSREAVLSNFCARGCPPPSAERLAADLIALLESPDECKRLGTECRALIREGFRIEEVCRRTREVYLRTIPQKPRARVALCGYFGCGNLGDDAILSGLLRGLGEVAPALSVIALSGSPRADRVRFGIEAHSRRNPLSILWTLLRADALLFGGGSLLQNATSNRSLLYYLHLIDLARLLRREVFFVGAGIGPLLGERACLRVRDRLNRARSVGLRDPESERRLRAFGVCADRLHSSADPALLLPPPPPSRADFLLRLHHVPLGCGLLAIVLHGGREATALVPLLLTAVRTVCARRGLTPVLLLFDPRQDTAVTYAARATLGAPILPLSEPADASAILALCRGVITLRLHAMILAAAVATPSLGIPADPRDEKIVSFARAVGARSIAQDALGVPALVEELEKMLDEHEGIRPILEDATREMRKKAAKDLANIAQMIYNSRQNDN